MDLSQAEKTLSDLEENGKKVAEVSRSIEKLKKISKELSKLPEDIEKNSSATALRIVDESDKLRKLIDKSVNDTTTVINENQEKQDNKLNQVKNDIAKMEIKMNNHMSSLKKMNMLLMLFVIILGTMLGYSLKLF